MQLAPKCVGQVIGQVPVSLYGTTKFPLWQSGKRHRRRHGGAVQHATAERRSLKHSARAELVCMPLRAPGLGSQAGPSEGRGVTERAVAVPMSLGGDLESQGALDGAADEGRSSGLGAKNFHEQRAAGPLLFAALR